METAKVKDETKKLLDYILTEITAGMVMIPRSENDKTWNNAHDRCKRIIGKYRNGEGIFQVTDVYREKNESIKSVSRQH